MDTDCVDVVITGVIIITHKVCIIIAIGTTISICITIVILVKSKNIAHHALIPSTVPLNPHNVLLLCCAQTISFQI